MADSPIDNFRGLPLTPTSAQEHVKDFFATHTGVFVRKQIIEHVIKRHAEMGGVGGEGDIASTVKRSLQMLQDEGFLHQPMRSRWQRTDQLDNRNTVEKVEDGDSPTPVLESQSGLYAYFFSSEKELALLKGENCWLMKVGYSNSDVDRRVADQVTGMHRQPETLLLREIEEGAEWEKFLHLALTMAGRRNEESPGKEWFVTNPAELENLLEGLEAMVSSLSVVETNSNTR